MSIILENKRMKVLVSENGAEVTSIIDKMDNRECIWTADSKYWGRHAPILFPIVGKVVNNEYKVNENTYSLGQHGFARDLKFDVISKEDNKVILELLYNRETLKVYPYKFKLYVEYVLCENALKVSYKVKNEDKSYMYFSIGAHPGFYCPGNFSDYYFEFEKEETKEIIPVVSGGYLKREKVPYLNNTKVIELNKHIFEEDALIFENLSSKYICLKNKKNSKGIKLSFEGFPFLGLWTKPDDAPFVCIEPWYGHADFEDFKGDFKDKDGIIKLNGEEEFNSLYTIELM